MKFCMITTFYPPYHFGGDAIYIYRLANELARRGHRVDVIHCRDAYRLFRKEAAGGAFQNHPNVRVYPAESRAGFLSPLLTQQTGRPFFKRRLLEQRIRKENYDVIHYHNMSLIGIGALAFGHAVKLYTTHEHWLICPMHVLWRYNREVCRRRTCIRCQLAGRRPPQLWRFGSLMKTMLGKVDLFISPSRFTLERHLEQSLAIPMVHLPYFLPGPDGLRTPPAAPGPAGSGCERPYFLFVGRLEKIKGLQNLIPVFKRRSEFDLLVAGDGEYAADLKRAAAGASNIRFLGRLSHERLQELYRRAVALIVPSICVEVFGIIIIEAFAMKTPVIVHALGAMPEVIEESGGGFVYSREDELVGAMESLAGDPDRRRRMGERGFRAFRKFWSEDAHIERYLSLIRQVQAQKDPTNADRCTGN